MARKDFMAKLKKSQEAFNKGKDAKARSMIEVDPGRYIVRLHSVDLDTGSHGDDDNVPYVQFNMVVVEGGNAEDVGAMVRYREYIKYMSGTKNGRDWEITEADQFASICRAFKAFGVDTSELELGDLPNLADDLQEEQPACRIQVKERKNSDYLEVRFPKGPMPDEEVPTLEDIGFDEDDDDEDDSEDDEVDDDDDQEDDDDSDDSDDDDSDDDDDDDEEDDDDYVPSKGDEVDAKPKGTRKYAPYTVTSVSKKNETCSLTREDGKVFKDQPWSCIK